MAKVTKNGSIVEYENVNGFPLCLKVSHSNFYINYPRSKYFKISYKNNERKSYWPKISLFLAVLFNVIAVCYVRISVIAIIVTLIVFSFLLFFWITHSVQSESLLVIPTVGIQSTVKYVYGEENNFISWSTVDDIIINEVIKLNRVLFFLTILVKTDQTNDGNEAIKLVPLFKYTKPRLMMLERIYSELQTLLIEERANTMGSGDVG